MNTIDYIIDKKIVELKINLGKRHKCMMEGTKDCDMKGLIAIIESLQHEIEQLKLQRLELKTQEERAKSIRQHEWEELCRHTDPWR